MNGKRDFSIAVKAVILRDGKVLVLHRSQAEMKASFLNKKERWDLPGGGLHYAERCEEGLAREILEETGLTVKILHPIGTFDVIRTNVHLCIITYLCHYRDGEVVLSGEHDAFDWLGEEDVVKGAYPRWMKEEYSW